MRVRERGEEEEEGGEEREEGEEKEGEGREGRGGGRKDRDTDQACESFFALGLACFLIGWYQCHAEG